MIHCFFNVIVECNLLIFRNEPHIIRVFRNNNILDLFVSKESGFSPVAVYWVFEMTFSIISDKWRRVIKDAVINSLIEHLLGAIIYKF